MGKKDVFSFYKRFIAGYRQEFFMMRDCQTFLDVDIDLLILADYFDGHLPIQKPPSYDDSEASAVFYDSISAERSVKRVYETSRASSEPILGPIDVRVVISQAGQEIVDRVPVYRKAIALLRFGFVREALPFIERLQLSELGVFLSHENEQVREAAIRQFGRLTRGDINAK